MWESASNSTQLSRNKGKSSLLSQEEEAAATRKKKEKCLVKEPQKFEKEASMHSKEKGFEEKGRSKRLNAKGRKLSLNKKRGTCFSITEERRFVEERKWGGA